MIPVRGLTLRQNFSWTLSGNVIYSACQWGMLSAITKLGNTEMTGQFALALALCTPIIAFSNMQLRSVQATDAQSFFHLHDYVWVRLLTTLVAVVSLSGIAVVTESSLQMRLLIVAMAIGKAADAISDIYYGFFQQHEQMHRIAQSMIWNGLLSLVFLIVGIRLTGSIVVGVVGSSFASILVLILFVLPDMIRILGGSPIRTTGALLHLLAIEVPRPNPKIVTQLINLALPLGIVILLVSLNTNIPRYFIGYARGENDLGIYSALAYLLLAGSTIVSALGHTVSPRLARLFASGKRGEFWDLIAKLMVVGLFCGILGAALTYLMGKQILSLIYTPEYADYNEVLFVLALTAGLSFAGSFLGYGLTAARKFSLQVPLFLVVVIVCTATCSILIPLYGLMGAAFALLSSTLVQVISSLVLLKITLRESET